MTNEMRENIWLIKMAQIITPKFNYHKETENSGAQWAFNGTCEGLQAFLSNFNSNKTHSVTQS